MFNHRELAYFKKENNTQFVVHNAIFVIKYQCVLYG